MLTDIIRLEKALHAMENPVEFASEDIQKLHTMHVDVVLSEDNLFDPTLYLQCGNHTQTQLQLHRNGRYNLALHRNLLIGATIIAAKDGETYKDIPLQWLAIDVNGERRPVIYNPIDNKFYTHEFDLYVNKCLGIKFKKPACGWYYGEKPKTPATTTVKSKRTRSEDIAR